MVRRDRIERSLWEGGALCREGLAKTLLYDLLFLLLPMSAFVLLILFLLMRRLLCISWRNINLFASGRLLAYNFIYGLVARLVAALVSSSTINKELRILWGERLAGLGPTLNQENFDTRSR
jgi:hypothetical protein